MESGRRARAGLKFESSKMLYTLLADCVVIVHLAFVAFVVGGGVLALRWRRVAWVHLPAAVWGAVVEFTGWICPLTPLENWLRLRGGEAGYGGGFVEHYLIPILYPAGLTRGTQIVLGVVVVTLNAVIYIYIFKKWNSNRVNRPGDLSKGSMNRRRGPGGGTPR